jgi:iron-sulfur cluster assembly protein
MQHPISITPAALQHLQTNLASSPTGTIGIRLGLRDAGCSGFAYTVDFTQQQNHDDHVFDFDGVKILIAADKFKPLAGMELNLVKQGVNSILEFNNPNVAQACGCGESVKFKEENTTSATSPITQDKSSA